MSGAVWALGEGGNRQVREGVCRSQAIQREIPCPVRLPEEPARGGIRDEEGERPVARTTHRSGEEAQRGAEDQFEAGEGAQRGEED